MIKNNNGQGRTFYIDTLSKFSTISFDIVFSQKLSAETVEKRNLVAKTLIEANQNYPSKRQMRAHLAELYAANVSSGVSKNGQFHEVTFQFSFVDPVRVNDEEYTIETIFQTISEILFAPALENGVFQESILEVEKRIMIAKINQLYDDKTRYAQMRAVEIMYEGTPVAIKAFGTVDAYKSITAQDVTQTYKEMLSQDGISIYAVGSLGNEIITERFNQMFDEHTKQKTVLKQEPFILAESHEIKYYVEPQDIQQAKLFVGYRTDVENTLKEYVATQMAVTVLGGGVHSKLFQNVREKASLAYTVSASMDMYAGSLFVYAGIDYDKKEEAMDIIDVQIDAIKNGEITDDEIFMSRQGLLHQIQASHDNAFAIIGLQKIMGRIDGLSSIELWMDALNKVTREDIVAIAQTWEKNTIYLLAPNTKEEGGARYVK